MTNPSGYNQFQGLSTDSPAYGDIAKLTALTRSAPMSGAPLAQGNAAQRAQRRAVRAGQVRPDGRGGAAAMATPPPPITLPSPAAVWAQIAATPGASPLVLQLAQKAAAGGV